MPLTREDEDAALELFRALLRIDTTNPPGNERPAAELLADWLREHAPGVEPTLLDAAPGRGNVVARLRGTGARGPLLLTAHLDVVPADAARWRHAPFSADVADGFAWGRGAIDMKHMAAMSAAVVAALARDGAPRARDVIFAGVADEEAGCDHGSRFLVDRHPDLVRAEIALGEAGGFPVHLPRKTYWLVQVAEKGLVWTRARVRGTPGHGSMPREDNAVVRLGAALGRLGHTRLPAHATALAERFINSIASAQPAPSAALLRQILRPALAPFILDRLPDRSVARSLDAQLRNTVSPTVLRAGSKTNVIPGEATCELDGRILPGQDEASFLAELRAVLGPDVELDLLRSAPPTVTDTAGSPVLDAVRAALLRAEPGAEVLPYMAPGFTDAQSWSRLGTRCYGFSPVRFDRQGGVRFADLYHGDDERIPVEGFRFGLRLLDDVVRRLVAAG